VGRGRFPRRSPEWFRPHDRDESIVRTSDLSVLADHLTRKGVDRPRFDKATQASTGDYANATTRRILSQSRAASLPENPPRIDPQAKRLLATLRRVIRVPCLPTHFANRFAWIVLLEVRAEGEDVLLPTVRTHLASRRRQTPHGEVARDLAF